MCVAARWAGTFLDFGRAVDPSAVLPRPPGEGWVEGFRIGRRWPPHSIKRQVAVCTQ